MAFPLKVLKGLQIRTSQKIGLSSVFCLAILVVIFDITRTVFSVISARGGAAGAGTVLWDILEATVAVIVSCLPTYGTIFTQKKQKKSKRNYTNITGQENLVKTQPSLELTSFENAMDGASNDRMKSRRVLGEDQHDLELPELFEQG